MKLTAPTDTSATTAAAPVDVIKTSNFVKITAIALLSSVIILLYRLPSSSFPSSISTSSPLLTRNASSSVSPPPPSPPPPAVAFKTGIVDENGAMTVDFIIGEFDPSVMDEWRNLTGGTGESKREDNAKTIKVKYQKYRVCEESKRDYIPCLDNVEEIERLNLSGSLEKYERHCPKQGKGLDCLVPTPKGYKRPMPWPKSRDEVVD